MARKRNSGWGTVAALGGFFGAIGLVTLATRSSRAAQPPPKRVALIGDSYAVGLGPELTKLLPNFQFEGHVGTNTAQWTNHDPACGKCGDWLPAFKPAIVLVSLGVNDGTAPDPVNYHAIVSALHGIGARVVWIEPPAGVTSPGIDRVRAVIASLGVQTVPALPLPMRADGVHPVSYGPWSINIAQAVQAVS